MYDVDLRRRKFSIDPGISDSIVIVTGVGQDKAQERWFVLPTM